MKKNILLFKPEATIIHFYLEINFKMFMNGFVRNFINLTGTTARRYYPLAAQSPAGVPLDESSTSSSVPDDKNRKISAQVDALVEQIVNLPLLEVSDLNFALKKRLNIPDTPFMPAGFAFQGSAATAPLPACRFIFTKTFFIKFLAATEEPQEEIAAPKISFGVKLTKYDETKKIALIKQIRDLIPGLNLLQAKKFVEGIPTEVKTDLGKNEAEELKVILEKVGGVCEIV